MLALYAASVVLGALSLALTRKRTWPARLVIAVLVTVVLAVVARMAIEGIVDEALPGSTLTGPAAPSPN